MSEQISLNTIFNKIINSISNIVQTLSTKYYNKTVISSNLGEIDGLSATFNTLDERISELSENLNSIDTNITQ